MQKVIRTESMFRLCKNLTNIFCDDDWTKYNISSSYMMFSDCDKLVGGNGTIYDESKTDIAYARPDEGSSAPGYFTGKKTPTGTDNVVSGSDGASKQFRNGILYILRNGRTYTPNGQLITDN